MSLSKMRLAYFSPLPPARTGIADYSAELIPHLARYTELTLFAERPVEVHPDLRSRFDVKAISDYIAERWAYDLALYHMGNHGHHASTYKLALRYPGVVVLHDYILHHFAAYATIGQGNYAGYARELGYALGSEGLDLAWAIRLGNRSMTEFELPLNNRLLDRSLGIIVHSQMVASKLSKQRPDRRVRVIPHEMASFEGHSYRDRLGLTEETVIFASTGLVNATKRIDLVLQAFARLRHQVNNVFYLIVGDVHNDVNLHQLIRQYDLNDAVKHTGYVQTMEEFINWTATADVVVNLRYPTLGETSGAALRALSVGRPIIVFDHGWYGELPDDVCSKVPPLDIEQLQTAMLDLAHQPDKRREMGQRAKKYVARYLDPNQIAKQYVHFLATILNQIEHQFD